MKAYNALLSLNLVLTTGCVANKFMGHGDYAKYFDHWGKPASITELANYGSFSHEPEVAGKSIPLKVNFSGGLDVKENHEDVRVIYKLHNWRDESGVQRKMVRQLVVKYRYQELPINSVEATMLLMHGTPDWEKYRIRILKDPRTGKEWIAYRDMADELRKIVLIDGRLVDLPAKE